MASPRASIPPRNICSTCLHRRLSSRLSRRTFTNSDRKLNLSSNEQPSSRLPRVAQPSFWRSLVPKPFRRSPQPEASPAEGDSATLSAQPTRRRRAWSPNTPIILLALLIGSNAINQIALRNDMAAFSRKTEAKLDLLREVIGRVRKGEEVDVRKELGTGEEGPEREWEEVMRELRETSGGRWPVGEGEDKTKQTKKDEDGRTEEREGHNDMVTLQRPKFVV